MLFLIFYVEVLPHATTSDYLLVFSKVLIICVKPLPNMLPISDNWLISYYLLVSDTILISRKLCTCDVCCTARC